MDINPRRTKEEWDDPQELECMDRSDTSQDRKNGDTNGTFSHEMIPFA
jgi:hypothetical protein